MKIKLYTGSITPSDGITRDVLVMVFKDTNTMQLFDQDSVHKSWDSFCSAEGIDDVDEMAKTLLNILVRALPKRGMNIFDPSKFPPCQADCIQESELDDRSRPAESTGRGRRTQSTSLR